MSDIISFGDALPESEGAEKHLLLGNGFSCALIPEFGQEPLLAVASFPADSRLKIIFNTQGIQRFEVALNIFEVTNMIAQFYGDISDTFIDKVRKEAQQIERIFIEAIVKKHPVSAADLDEEQTSSCIKFLKNFDKKYTLNYDLLLYWIIVKALKRGEMRAVDGFDIERRVSDVDYLAFDPAWSLELINFFYLHGGLQLFVSGQDTLKRKCGFWGVRIIDQARIALEKGQFPLFVAGGDHQLKQRKIDNNTYLSKCLQSFKDICADPNAILFIFGCSLNCNDEHILSIIRNGRIGRVYVSTYRNADDSYDPHLEHRARGLAVGRQKGCPLEITMFDADTANVWGKLDTEEQDWIPPAQEQPSHHIDVSF